MLSLKNFKRLTLEDKKVFDNLYAKYPPPHSDNLFTTMISWMEYIEYHYALVDNNVITMIKMDGEIQFRPPFGKPNLDLFKQVLELAFKEGTDSSIGLIDNQTKKWISEHFPKIKFIEDRDFFDYIYLSSDLAELPGSSYGKIRNRYNKFKRNYEYSTEIISEKNMDEVSKFLKRWCLWRDCESDILLENEKKAILYSMSHFFDLGLSGLVIRIDDNIEAISVFEKMSPDTAVIHYEKGSPFHDGIYKAINLEAAKLLQKDFTYINREADMGEPGLRQAKMSYRPHHMTEVYHIKKV